MADVRVLSETRQVLTPQQTLQRIDGLRREPQGVAAVMYNHVAALGLTPSAGVNNVLGHVRGAKASAPVVGPNGPVSALTLDLYVQDLKGTGPNVSAVVLYDLKGGNERVTEARLLVAPEGHLLEAKESKVVNGAVVQTNSWWTHTHYCIGKYCPGECAKALATCVSGSWVACLGSLIWNCLGCAVSCGACSSCKCQGWCSWWVGCQRCGPWPE